MKASKIAEQIAQVDRDLAEIDEQLAAGDLDEATADRLRAAYVSERTALEAQLETIAESGTDDAEADGGTVVASEAPEGRSRGRALTGTIVFAVAAIVVVVVAVLSLQDQTPAGEMTDGVATDVLEGQSQGQSRGSAGAMDSVSLEEMESVVAQHPDVVGMRVALAQRYLNEAGDLNKGLEHYTIALSIEPEDPSLNAWVGWLTFLSGDATGAEVHLVKAIELDPDYPQAYWFLANIRFENDDKAGAIEPLEKLLTYDGVPPDIVADVEAMLEEARA